MFHWICPECGQELAPSMTACPACEGFEIAATSAELMTRDLTALAAINEPSVAPAVLSETPAAAEDEVTAEMPIPTPVAALEPVLVAAAAPVAEPAPQEAALPSAVSLKMPPPPPLPPAPESLPPLAARTPLAFRKAPVRSAGKSRFDAPSALETALPGPSFAAVVVPVQSRMLTLAPAGKLPIRIPHISSYAFARKMPDAMMVDFGPPLARIPNAPGIRRPMLGWAGRTHWTAKTARQLRVFTPGPAALPKPSGEEAALFEVWKPVQFSDISNEGFDQIPFRRVRRVRVSLSKGFGMSVAVAAGLSLTFAGIAHWPGSQKGVAVPAAAEASTGQQSAGPAAPPSTPAKPANSLSQQVEVTGIRFVTPPNRKAEIHYIVVNHSPVNLSNITIFVTLRLNGTSPAQAPLSRFSFRAPELPPFESREMTSFIEKMPTGLTLPDWQNVRADISLGQ